MTVGNEVYGEREEDGGEDGEGVEAGNCSIHCFWLHLSVELVSHSDLHSLRSEIEFESFPSQSSFCFVFAVFVSLVAFLPFTSLSAFPSLIPFTRFSPSQTHTFLSGSLDQVFRCFNFSTRTASRLFQDHHLYFKMSDNGNNDEKSNNSETEVLSSTTAAAATTSPTSLKRPHHEVSKVLRKSACYRQLDFPSLAVNHTYRMCLKVLERVSASLALFFH